ncbi:hypothetical protein Tco_1084460, partial [Tanacetum coccineum]
MEIDNLRGSSLQRKIVSFREIHDLNFRGSSCKNLFVLSSSNRGRLLGFTDLMRQKNKIMKQGLIQHYGILEDLKSNSNSVPCKSKAASVPAGSRNSSASVTAGGSDPAASRNRPAVNSAGRSKPTERVGQPAGWDDGVLLLRPQQVTLGGIKDHNFGGPRVMGDPSTDNDIGIVDSGCSRSMTGNKEKHDDFVPIKEKLDDFNILTRHCSSRKIPGIYFWY